MIVLRSEVYIGQIAPSTAFHIIGRALPIGVGGHLFLLYRKFIYAPTAHRRRRFRPEKEALRLLGNKLFVEIHTVVESRNVKGSIESTLGIGLGIVSSAGHSTTGVELMTELGHGFCSCCAFFVPLFGNLVADTPHHDRGVIAMSADQVFEVFAPPFVVETVVAVLHFGLFPGVEALGHDHHSHRVAHVHLHLRGHVVRGADGIGPHFLHQTYLTNERSLVDGGSKRT